MDRREFIAVAGGAWFARPRTAHSGDAIRRIGVLMGLPEDDEQASRRLQSLRRALARLGWEESRNIRIDFRGASDVEGLRSRAVELVQLHPEVIVAHATPATNAVRQASQTVPVVFVSVSDPIGNGFVESLARPAGNITGFTNFEPEIGGKWVQLVKELAPAVTHVGMLYNPATASDGATGGVYLHSARQAAAALRLEFGSGAAEDVGGIESVFASLAGKPGGAVIVMPNVFTAVHRKEIVALAAKHALPAIYPFRYFVGIGGLVSYGVDLLDLFRRAASYVDVILRGAKPSDLPVESPIKFEFAINIRTAKNLGLIVPPRLGALADEVIQ